MTKTRFGIIGCGRIAPRHADSISKIPNAELAMASDVIESRAYHLTEKHGGRYCTNYYDILASPDIDIVNICTPSGMHAAMAIEALKAGKHVIVEKPMALSIPDADRMIATAKEANRKLCIILQNRYNPPMQDFYRTVHSGKIGRILLGAVTVRWYRPQEYYSDGWHGTESMDGGALMNQSIHHIDALQWLVGSPVESVFAYTATLAHQMETEDVGVATLRFANGALATVEGSTVTFPQNLEASVALFGEKGSLKVGGTALNRKIFWKIAGEIEHEQEALTREELDPPSIYGASHEHVIEDMIQAIREDREPQTNGVEGRKSLLLVTAMYESARSSREVFLRDWERHLAI